MALKSKLENEVLGLEFHKCMIVLYYWGKVKRTYAIASDMAHRF